MVKPGEKSATYTYYGVVLDRLIRSRGYSQSSFSRRCRDLGYKVRQNSLSHWMSGVYQSPRWFPPLLDRVLKLEDDEWVELGLAYAYGQELPADRREDSGMSERVTNGCKAKAEAGTKAEAREAADRRIGAPAELTEANLEGIGSFRRFYREFSANAEANAEEDSPGRRPPGRDPGEITSRKHS